MAAHVSRPSGARSRYRADGPRILVLSGPNLQLLGTREPEIYGKETLDEIHRRLEERAGALGASIDAFQTNHEGAMLDRIGEARGTFNGLLVNGGAWTHTSLALYDAIRAVAIPCVEVHLSNPEAREAYRAHSKIAPACIGKVSGFGADSYLLGLEGLIRWLARHPTPSASK